MLSSALFPLYSRHLYSRSYPTGVARGSVYSLAFCPINQATEQLTIRFAEIDRLISVGATQARGLSATNAICGNPNCPGRFPLGD